MLEQTLVDGVLELPVLGRAGGGVKAVSEAPMESLNLAPGKHILEFHYTGLSFDAPDRVRFRYRLEGLDQDWVEAGTRRVAFYSSVPPGSYHFQVIACNGDGVWNEAGASLKLTVLQHFWQTWWFIGGWLWERSLWSREVPGSWKNANYSSASSAWNKSGYWNKSARASRKTCTI